mmetsp:Transcript_9842/g.24720  ORF Transcript_9842/g.24720 Transcript_9842/m.24720 type:complete len:407 (-) Transcript_9842:235-1455(-)
MAAVTYEVKAQARCLAAVEGDADRSRFIVGTLNLRASNELHIVEFSEDTNELAAVAIYATPHEVWHLAACPTPSHASKLLIVLNDGGASHYASLTVVPVLDVDDAGGHSRGAGTRAALPETVQLMPSAGSVAAHGLMRTALWNPAEDVTAAVTIQSGAMCRWPLDRGDAHPSPSASCTADGAFGTPLSGTAPQSIESACWDPHHAHTLALGSASGAISTIDLRTAKRAHGLAGAHKGSVRVLSFNPNRPYVLLSASDDRTMRFWDLRKAGAVGDTSPSPSAPAASSSEVCLLTMADAHMHWTCSAQFNRFHDQLILTAGTDSTVKLWRAASISSVPPTSEPLDGDEADADRESERDGLIKKFTEHEESVYSLVWSAADAWLFASLSLDGKLCTHYVPAAEKYRILL